MITLEQAITASGSHPERLHHKELTPIVKDNLTKLLEKVNALLTEVNIADVTISSGFRPSDVNAATPGSAKKSLHMSGNAVDILDDARQTIGKLIASRPDLLKKHELFIEDLGSTPTWCHLDDGIRADRLSRSFKP